MEQGMARTQRTVSIRRVWTLSTLILLAASLIVAAGLRAQTGRILAALEADEDRADVVYVSVAGRLSAMLNQEVGLRGFLATGNPEFLEPYTTGRADEARLRAKLVLDELPTEDRDELRQALLLEAKAARRWHDEIAEPQIALRRATASIDLPLLLVTGKARFDAYRAAHGTLRQALKRAFLNCERRRREQLSRANLVSGALLALLVLVCGVVSRAILRRTIAPLVSLSDAAERGEVSVDAVRSSSLREVRVLAETLERLFRGVQDRAMRDGLTRVYNRGYLAEWLPRHLRLARRNKAPLAALMVDVDHFKRINDTHGHAAGDQVLVALARCLERELRATDVVVRYGGEEFTVILPDTPVAGGFVSGERLRAAIAALTEREGLPAGVRITASIGVAAVNAGEEGAQLLSRADAALYQAKRGGRNRVVAASAQVKRPAADKSAANDNAVAPADSVAAAAA
jgi:diguanylate cyclase (GGDEF)-like protein